MAKKYIFVTGGVVSSLGKGIASAAIGRLLESQGLKVALLKFDPYLNVDAGTMNPYQHGEVYVTDDGAETDLDLGHYFRFTTAKLGRINNVTTGQIYREVISRERKGDFLGGTIQVIPHITDEIKRRIKLLSSSRRSDVVILEIGGTVGDIESLPFLEAARQFGQEQGRDNVIYIHLTLIPYVRAADEIKTKPTQHSVERLREIGIQPDILLCRTERPLTEETKAKISLFCNVKPESVIEALDVKSVYEIPLIYEQQRLDRLILRRLKLKKSRSGNLSRWKRKVVNVVTRPAHEVEIAVVGKYVRLKDAYKSIYEALVHGGIANNAAVKIRQVEAEQIEKDGAARHLEGAAGILVPGGFGQRGIEGKIAAVAYAREKNVPFLGICLGMQCAVMDFARNVCGLAGADSTEFNKSTPHPVISLLEEQKQVNDKGGTMRLGAYPCRTRKKTRAWQAYRRNRISERHRHRYEFNDQYRELMENKGMIFSGIHPEKNLVEMVELKEHIWFVACQFHPEFKSRPDAAHPLFRAFVEHALKNSFR